MKFFWLPPPLICPTTALYFLAGFIQKMYILFKQVQMVFGTFMDQKNWSAYHLYSLVSLFEHRNYHLDNLIYLDFKSS